MADVPMSVAAPAATVLVAAISTLFGLLLAAKSSESKAWKAAFKSSVKRGRGFRRELEIDRTGVPSVPPPPDDSDIDDDTQRILAIDREDARFDAPRGGYRIRPGLPDGPPLAAFEDRTREDPFRDARSPEERRRNESERDVRKYVTHGQGESTPPDPALPPKQRPKLSSRRG